MWRCSQQWPASQLILSCQPVYGTSAFTKISPAQDSKNSMFVGYVRARESPDIARERPSEQRSSEGTERQTHEA